MRDAKQRNRYIARVKKRAQAATRSPFSFLSFTKNNGSQSQTMSSTRRTALNRHSSRQTGLRPSSAKRNRPTVTSRGRTTTSPRTLYQPQGRQTGSSRPLPQPPDSHRTASPQKSNRSRSPSLISSRRTTSSGRSQDSTHRTGPPPSITGSNRSSASHTTAIPSDRSRDSSTSSDRRSQDSSRQMGLRVTWSPASPSLRHDRSGGADSLHRKSRHFDLLSCPWQQSNTDSNMDGRISQSVQWSPSSE